MPSFVRYERQSSYSDGGLQSLKNRDFNLGAAIGSPYAVT